MRKSLTWTALIFALSLAAAGCQTKIDAIDTAGAGFSKLKPNAGTRDYIIKNDRPFAEAVAGNNRACERSPACQK